MTSTERLAANPEPQTAPVPDGAVRCTHADREQTAGRLQEATGDGRLSMDETEERLGRVYAARYHYDLDAHGRPHGVEPEPRSAGPWSPPTSGGSSTTTSPCWSDGSPRRPASGSGSCWWR
jgi:hypothetical protein